MASNITPYPPEVVDWLAFDRAYVWHPYSAMGVDLPTYPVVRAEGVQLWLADGRRLIDGMSSWWCAIHGYNHPSINAALQNQLQKMAHIMFGGLSHQPAAVLAQQLVALTPEPLQSVFFADSGSVSVEVALKMAIQYWNAKNQAARQHFLTLRHGYHGDTLGAMSICDPVNGMHTLFRKVLPKQYFVDSPPCRFGEVCTAEDIAPLEQQLAQHHQKIAAIILEPIVQGAGGMRFYSAEYLRCVRTLCDQFGVLLILDEIATGFGRTGRMFACQHAGITPDILCLGKALTGGYLSLAATLCTTQVSHTIAQGEPGLFMHGPTFMANPLACAAGLASLALLTESPWAKTVAHIEQGLEAGLAPCRGWPGVVDVRVLGAIGVVELAQKIELRVIQPLFVEAGVWVRPFGCLVYLMPPFIISEAELGRLTKAICEVVSVYLKMGDSASKHSKKTK